MAKTPRAPTGITLRTATEETFAQIAAPLAFAFGEQFSDAELENERQVAELDRVIGAFDGDTAVGASGAFTFRLTTPGGEVGAAGITLVGVLPTHRRRGILRLMMEDLFETARDRGEPVAILWASEAAIYQRFGYGLATYQTTFDASKDKVAFGRPSGLGDTARVRIVEKDEAMTLIPPIYDARRLVVPGSLNRTDQKWRFHLLHDADWMQSGIGFKVRAVLEVDGVARAYVIYRIRADWQATGPHSVVSVLELIGLDPAAEQALWEWVFSLDLVGTVKCWRGPVPHPLSLMITEPRRLNMSVQDGMWLRIIDLPAALAGRRYAGPGSLVLDVADEFCPTNAGRWRLTVPGPDAPGEVARADDAASPDLALDISALAGVYLGTVRVSDLAHANRIRECRPGALAAADTLLASPISPYNSTMF